MGRQSLPHAPDLTRLGGFARDIWRWVGAYAANPDTRVASCNAIALLVASNQPFYPLYVYFSVSAHIAPTLLTFLSTPFFLAIPAISRAVSRFRSRASAADGPRQCGCERKSIRRGFRGW